MEHVSFADVLKSIGAWIINSVRNVIFFVITALFIISLIANFYFLKIGGAIKVDKSIHNISNQMQGQSQGTFIMNDNIVVSGEIKWKIVPTTVEKLQETLNMLGPSSIRAFLLRSKWYSDEIFVFYMVTKKK